MFWRRHWQIICILLLAVVLRLPLLNGSFWLDEAAQALESARPLAQQLQIVNDFQPPLIHILVHFLLIISRSEWWLRIGAAVIPGLITIWGVYEIGREIGGQAKGKKIGAVAAFLLATSPFHIFYSQELRPYSLPAMFAVLSWFMLIRGQRRAHWIWFTLLTIGGLYASYLYPFLLMSQVVFTAFLQRKKIKPLIASLGISGLSFLPWLPMFFQQLQAGQLLRTALPGWQAVVSFTQAKSLLLTIGKFIVGMVSLKGVIWLVFIAILLSGIAVLMGTWLVDHWSELRQKPHPVKVFWLLLCWLLLPILSAWLVSFIVPVLQPKRVLFSLPAFYLLFAFLVTTTTRRAVTLFCQLFLLVFFINVHIFALTAYFVTPQYQREDWRSLHQEIITKYPESNSIIIFSFPEAFAPWRWYDDGSYPSVVTGKLYVRRGDDLSILRQATEYRYVLVPDYLRDLTDPDNAILAELEKYGYHEVDRITPKTSLGVVRVYARDNATLSLGK